MESSSLSYPDFLDRIEHFSKMAARSGDIAKGTGKDAIGQVVAGCIFFLSVPPDELVIAIQRVQELRDNLATTSPPIADLLSSFLYFWTLRTQRRKRKE